VIDYMYGLEKLDNYASNLEESRYTVDAFVVGIHPTSDSKHSEK
jgi:hypothetical protein